MSERNLRRAESPAVEAGEAAEILSPYAMAVPLVGRERELADLWTWMNGDSDLSIRVITAPGGGGKTRLALELCEEAVERGWHAGFVPPEIYKILHAALTSAGAEARQTW